MSLVVCWLKGVLALILVKKIISHLGIQGQTYAKNNPHQVALIKTFLWVSFAWWREINFGKPPHSYWVGRMAIVPFPLLLSEISAPEIRDIIPAEYYIKALLQAKAAALSSRHLGHRRCHQHQREPPPWSTDSSCFSQSWLASPSHKVSVVLLCRSIF